MQRSIIRTAGFCLVALFALQAYAGPYDAPAVPKEEGKALKTEQTGTSVQPVQKQDPTSRYSKSKRERNRLAREKSSGPTSGGTGTIKAAPGKSGSSVVERDKKRYAIQKRAADRRAAELKKAKEAKKPAASGSSVLERDQKRYEVRKRAAARRAAEMKKAENAGKKSDVMMTEPSGSQGQPPVK